jgi:hypothetical protein
MNSLFTSLKIPLAPFGKGGVRQTSTKSKNEKLYLLK